MESGHALVVERYLTAYKHIKHHPETPYIHLRASVHLGIEKFGSSKVEGAAEC
jgi:hypothetical protein